VAIDDFDDASRHLLADVIAALFRMAARHESAHASGAYPFCLRIALPAESSQWWRTLAANPTKDFAAPLVLRWTAADLITLAGNRLRTFLDLYLPHAPASLGLPLTHDPRDREAAEATLRAVLPSQPVSNDFGGREDALAYIIRHTQMLPRHVVLHLNEIIAPSLAGLSVGALPEISPTDVTAAVRHGQLLIAEDIIGRYSVDYPLLSEALAMMKNHADPVMPVGQFHAAFNRAGAARSGMAFDEFLTACLAIGALGVVTGETARYVRGQFAYNGSEGIRPVEDRDSVCVHPVFLDRWFERRAIRVMTSAGVKAVYPSSAEG
jgi:hypothetical protein